MGVLVKFPSRGKLIDTTALITAHQAFLTREALSEIACVTTANVLHLETGGPFLAGTTL